MKQESKEKLTVTNNIDLQTVVFTTLLIEKSPQAIPLGAACVASAVKNHKKTKDLCKTTLLVFNKEDKCFRLVVR